MKLQLMRVPGEYAAHRLAPDAAVPEAAWSSPFVSVSRSSEELSVITDAGIRVDAQSTVGPWLAYRVAGTIDFGVTGVMSALTTPLADAGLGILGISTYDTDYILVHADAGEAAEIAWRGCGFEITGVVVAAAIERDERYLVARRTRPAAVAGRWEFPGGKVEPGESEEQALAREIREELGVEIAIGERVPGEWPLHSDLVLHLYRATLVDGEPMPLEQHDEIRWVEIADFDSVDLLPSDTGAVRSLREATA